MWCGSHGDPGQVIHLNLFPGPSQSGPSLRAILTATAWQRQGVDTSRASEGIGKSQGLCGAGCKRLCPQWGLYTRQCVDRALPWLSLLPSELSTGWLPPAWHAPDDLGWPGQFSFQVIHGGIWGLDSIIRGSSLFMTHLMLRAWRHGKALRRTLHPLLQQHTLGPLAGPSLAREPADFSKGFSDQLPPHKDSPGAQKALA